MSESWSIVIVALIVGVTGVVTPALLAYLAARQRRADKQEDWARQDAVAEQVADAAEKAAGAARLLLVDNQKVAEAAATNAEIVNGKLGQIHDLVNSNMTEALEGQLAAIVSQLFLARKVARLEPTVDDARDIDALEARVAELRGRLDDRARQTAIADSKLATGHDRRT